MPHASPKSMGCEALNVQKTCQQYRENKMFRWGTSHEFTSFVPPINDENVKKNPLTSPDAHLLHQESCSREQKNSPLQNSQAFQMEAPVLLLLVKLWHIIAFQCQLRDHHQTKQIKRHHKNNQPTHLRNLETERGQPCYDRGDLGFEGGWAGAEIGTGLRRNCGTTWLSNQIGFSSLHNTAQRSQ